VTGDPTPMDVLRDADDLLRRLSDWDMLNGYLDQKGVRVWPTADAPYWQNAIAKMRIKIDEAVRDA
jgi:hypothetical protein